MCEVMGPVVSALQTFLDFSLLLYPAQRRNFSSETNQQDLKIRSWFFAAHQVSLPLFGGKRV